MRIAEAIKTIGEDIAASYDSRVKAIGTLVKDTHQMLKGFDAEHKDMAGALKESLEKGETDRLKVFKDMMRDIVKDIKDIETYVENKLKEFSDAHADMSEELKKDLAKYVDDMVKATRKLMGDIQARQKERNAQVADLLEAYKIEREKMAANWQALTAAMDNIRGIKPRVEAEVKVRSVKKAIEEVAIKEETKEDIVAPEIGLEEKVLEFIERHPEGVKVGDMEEPLGAPRMRLGVVAKGLLAEGKVRKEENIYFPV